MTVRPALITGGAGFIGSNLADRLAASGEDVLVFDSLKRPGVERNVRWLQDRHPSRISVVTADVRDEAALADAALEASSIFHLAAQVAVTTSLVSPADDFDVNAVATFRLLDRLRSAGQQTPLIYASTNKVYGDLSQLQLAENEDALCPADPEIAAVGIGEEQRLDFHTPYGCSKGAADQYVLDFARSFGLPAAVMRMSCIYGPRQMGTEDQGWVAHFLIKALHGQHITIFGDGRQVRDILHVRDAVDAYLALRSRVGTLAGHAYNLGGGPGNAVSLLQLVRWVEQLLGRPVGIRFAEARPGDQRYFVSDTRRAARDLGLARPTDWRSGVGDLLSWLRSEHGLPAQPLVDAAE